MMDVISKYRRRRNWRRGGQGWRNWFRRLELRFDAGGFFGALGSLLAVFGFVTAFSYSGVSIVCGILGASLGVLGYFLGSRSLGGAAIVLCIVSLFVGLSASQGLFF